jgi:Fur family transcriptional regulator, ferric uptake regulator
VGGGGRKGRFVTVSRSGRPITATHLGAALSALRAHGLRVSSARRLVLEALFSAERAVTAEEIASGLGGRVPPSDLASVYRNLETLERVGIVRHMHLGHGPGLYALTGSGPLEYVACESCRSVQVLDADALERLRRAVQECSGYEARFSHFPIIGLCPRCADEVRHAHT